jgi:phage gp36-like protein
MSYATLEDLKKALTEATLIDLTDDNDLGVIDTAVVENALEAADVEIDAYVGERYSLPLTEVHAIIGKMSADLAIFNLYSRRQGPPDHWQARYNNAIKMLGMIRDGKLGLGVADPDTGDSNTAEVVSVDRIFTRDSLKNF